TPVFSAIVFEWPLGCLFIPPVALLLAFAAWRQRKLGLTSRKAILLASLRGIALLLLVFLVARPVWVVREPASSAARSVAVLIDRSESMSLQDHDVSRYEEALAFLRDRLLPALKSVQLPVQAMLFDQSSEPADGEKLHTATPNGKRT